MCQESLSNTRIAYLCYSGKKGRTHQPSLAPPHSEISSCQYFLESPPTPSTQLLSQKKWYLVQCTPNIKPAAPTQAKPAIQTCMVICACGPAGYRARSWDTPPALGWGRLSPGTLGMAPEAGTTFPFHSWPIIGAYFRTRPSSPNFYSYINFGAAFTPGRLHSISPFPLAKTVFP